MTLLAHRNRVDNRQIFKVHTKKWIKLARLCPTYQAVDFILKYSTKNGCDNAGSPITAKKHTTDIYIHTVKSSKVEYKVNK